MTCTVHRPVADVQRAISLIQESGADVLLSVGGGSPIDSAKAVAFNLHKETGNWIPSIAIPTTLSVAETTHVAGFTDEEGHKTAVADPELTPKGIPFSY